MKKVFIVGGDGFARECHSNLNVMKRDDPSIEFGGFLGHGGYGHTVDYKHLQEFYLGKKATIPLKMMNMPLSERVIRNSDVKSITI